MYIHIKDSIKLENPKKFLHIKYNILTGYDCCSLTLQPCRTPMVSPEGWLFDKEALLKYIIEKKQEYARKLKEYERQKDRDLKVFYSLERLVL